jgi:hypothetical protein
MLEMVLLTIRLGEVLNIFFCHHTDRRRGDKGWVGRWVCIMWIGKERKKVDNTHCIGLYGLRSVVLDECGCVVGSKGKR